MRYVGLGEGGRVGTRITWLPKKTANFPIRVQWEQLEPSITCKKMLDLLLSILCSEIGLLSGSQVPGGIDYP